MKDAFPKWFAWFAVAAAGALLWSVVPAAVDALSTPQTPLLWWLGRAFGLVAYLSMFLSMVFGVFIGSRGAGGLLHAATLLQLHRYWALASLIATGVHVLLIVANTHAGIGGIDAIVPFASEHLRGPVALGSIALWGMGAVALSTALRHRLPVWVWRAVHGMTFGVFLLSLAHAVTAGTDTSSPVVMATYAATTTALVAAIIQRVLLAVSEAKAKKSGQPARGVNAPAPRGGARA